MGDICAGTLTWQLIDLGFDRGPIISESSDFSLKPLESKALHLPDLTQMIHTILNSSAVLPFLPHPADAFVRIHASIAIDQPWASRSKSATRDFGAEAHVKSEQSSVRRLHRNLGVSYGMLMSRALAAVQDRLEQIKACLRNYGSELGSSLVRLAPFSGQSQASLSTCTATVTEEGKEEVALLQHEHSVLGQLAAPNRRYLQGLMIHPHPAVVDALSLMPTASEALLLLSELKGKHVVPNPNIRASNFKLVSPYVAEFELRTTAVALYVMLDADVAGRFSDNNLLLLPWEPKAVAFLYDHSAQSTDALEHSLVFLSAADTKFEL